MKITLHPRKTIRVPFLRSKAKVKLEHRLTLEYQPWQVKENAVPVPTMRYTLTDIQTKEAIPPSELIVLQKGIPVMVTTTKGTPGTGKLESNWMSDPLVEISDKVANVTKVKQEEKRLSARVIERYREETIVRAVKITNKTGRAVQLRLLLLERPSEGIVFVKSEPAPAKSAPPEHEWTLQIPIEAEANVTLTLSHKGIEKIELPPDRPSGAPRHPDEAVYAEPAAQAAGPFDPAGAMAQQNDVQG